MFLRVTKVQIKKEIMALKLRGLKKGVITQFTSEIMKCLYNRDYVRG